MANELYMGKFDSIDNWTVITEEEKAEIEEEIAKKQEGREKQSEEVAEK